MWQERISGVVNMSKTIEIDACAKVFVDEKSLVPYERHGVKFVYCPHFGTVDKSTKNCGNSHKGCELANRFLHDIVMGRQHTIFSDEVIFCRIPKWCPLKGSRPKVSKLRVCTTCEGYGRTRTVGVGRNRKILPDYDSSDSYRKWDYCKICSGIGLIVK